MNEVTARLKVLYPDVIRHTLYHTIRDKSEVYHINHQEHSHRSRRTRVLSKRALRAMRPKMSLAGASFSRRTSWLLLALPCSCCGLSPCQPTPNATLRHNVPLHRNLDSTHSGIQLQEYRTGPGSIFTPKSPGFLSNKCSSLCSLCKYLFTQLLHHSEVQTRPVTPNRSALTRQSCFFIRCPIGASWNPLRQVLET